MQANSELQRCARDQVSVIVVNYNAGDLLKNCVESVLSRVREVIIVDNASTDQSLQRCTDLAANDGHLRVLQAGRNLGFAAACNVGIEAASGDYLLFLNPDSVAHPGAVEALLEVLLSDPRAGVAGGLLLNPDGSEQRGARRSIPTPWRAFLRLTGLGRLGRRWPVFGGFELHEQPLPERPAAIEAISGACMLVRRSAQQQVGLWDEGYFLHCEDLDWCMRFNLAGWNIMFVPAARITHVQGGCSGNRQLFIEWHKHQGMLRFYRKFYTGFLHRLLGVPIVALGVYLHMGAVALRQAVRRVLHNG